MKEIALFLSSFVFVGMTAQAQDRLEPVRTNHTALCLRMYRQEYMRLLNVHNAKWGVFRRPSNMTESSLTYDERARTLVYTEIEGFLWGNVTKATTKRIEERNSVRIIDLEEPQNYQAPSTTTTLLPIPNHMAKNLKKLWDAAARNPEQVDWTTLDGCTWEFFVNGKRAKAHSFRKDWTRVPRLTQLVDNLMEAVSNKDTETLLQLEQETIELRQQFEK